MQQFISDHNYYPGLKPIPKGTVFTKEEWVSCGGSIEGLEGHLEKGYIKSFNVSTPVEESGLEAVCPLVVPETPPAENKPQGIWSFDRKDLEGQPLEILNMLYKDHASKYSIKVRRYDDIEKLISKMTSEA